MSKWKVAASGLFANSLLLVICILAVSPHAIRYLSLWYVLAFSSLLCLADLGKLENTDADDRLPTHTLHHALCILTGTVVFAIWVSAAICSHSFDPWRWAIACVAAIVGAAIRGWATRQLGPQFVSAVEYVGPKNRLMTRGIYTHIRHPSELGLVLLMSAGWIATGSEIVFLLWGTMLLPLSWLRIRMEEAALNQQFGGAYRRYASNTGAYLPKWPSAATR